MKKFKRIYIEITNACNMSCSFCPESNRKKEFMSLESFEHILKEIEGYTDYIYLHVKGEPFIHPELKDFLTLAEQYKFKVNLTTNGTLIDKTKDILLASKSLRQINFSLHSFEEKDNIKHSDYLNNIALFTETTGDIIISLRLWNLSSEDIQEENKDTLKFLSKYFKINEIENKFKRGKGIKLAEKVYLNFEEVFEWPALDMPFNSDTGRCQGLNSHIGILADGTVIPCCLDQNAIINLGNIHDTSLKEILSSNKTLNIINGFKNNKIIEELCTKCTFRNRFD